MTTGRINQVNGGIANAASSRENPPRETPSIWKSFRSYLREGSLPKESPARVQEAKVGESRLSIPTVA